MIADEGDKASSEDVTFIEGLRAMGAIAVSNDAGVEHLRIGPVDVYYATARHRLLDVLSEKVDELHPDWLMLDAPDWLDLHEWPNGPLIERAIEKRPGRVVVLNQTSPILPPAWRDRIVRRTRDAMAGSFIVSVSKFSARHFEATFGLESAWMYCPAYGSGPFPNVASFDSPFVTIINPSAIKGLSIFVGLARALPHIQFAAVPTWATKSEDREVLEHLPNVTLLAPEEDVTNVFARTRVLLVPSLWLDTFPLVTIEAMLRGIPVLASHVGGNPETKLGTKYLLSARPYEDCDADGNPIIPEQDLGPWIAALLEVLSDRAAYEAESAAIRDIASNFVARLGVEPFERMLEERMEESARSRVEEPAATWHA